MSLQRQLDALREQEIARTPPAIRKIHTKAMQVVAASGVLDTSLVVGDRAPDFDLEDVEGRTVRLQSLRDQGPVILDFFRGGWCPFCSLELRAYQELVEDIDGAGASLVAIAPEMPALLREAARENRITFPVLSDPGNEIARRYGLVFTVPEALRSVYAGFGLDLPTRQGNTAFELPIPGTYLVGSDGTVQRAYVELDHTRRGEPTDFLAAVRALRGNGD